MIRILLAAFVIISLNVILQAVTYIAWSNKIYEVLHETKKKLTGRRELWMLLWSFFAFTVLHVIHSMVWALFFYITPDTSIDFNSFAEALYFSLVTFTTLGYGDITLQSGWKLLAGFEAINGIMLIGWTTANMFSLIQNIYKRRLNN